jgi:hypothetical protein
MENFKFGTGRPHQFSEPEFDDLFGAMSEQPILHLEVLNVSFTSMNEASMRALSSYAAATLSIEKATPQESIFVLRRVI